MRPGNPISERTSGVALDAPLGDVENTTDGSLLGWPELAELQFRPVVWEPPGVNRGIYILFDAFWCRHPYKVHAEISEKIGRAAAQ